MHTKQCDCCGKQRYSVRLCWADYVGDTYCCSICSGDPLGEVEAMEAALAEPSPAPPSTPSN
jgi:hypothetical protein